MVENQYQSSLKNVKNETFLKEFFSKCRKLRKPRVTRIHMNLFASMILQCLVRLVIYADQWIVRQQQQNSQPIRQNLTNVTISSTKEEVWGIDNTVSKLCF